MPSCQCLADWVVGAAQYNMFPDTPGPEAASTASEVVPSASEEPNQAPLPSRTRLYGNVLRPLAIASTGQRAGKHAMLPTLLFLLDAIRSPVNVYKQP